MSYTRPIDEAATKQARTRQQAGEQTLQEWFRLPYDYIRARRVGLPMVHSRDGLVVESAPFRGKPGCPRPRSESERARHLRRKRQRAARRCNRA